MKGFILLEVLIALLIFSLGLFSIAGLQLSALQHTEEAYWQSVAATQLSSLFERLRANQAGATRKKEKEEWNKLNALLLPKGRGDYTCKAKKCEAFVLWKTREEHTLSTTAYF